MRISSLKLYNFRGFSQYSVCFNSGINVLFGPNAAGKTSILEAVNYLSLTKSFKTSDEFNIIKDGESEFSLIGKLESSKEAFDLKIIKDLNGKSAFKNSFKFSKLSDYIGQSLVVSFDNNDLISLNGSSRNRRKIFEPIFCQISKDYVVACNYYKKILNERNALLKRLIFENNHSLLELLDTLENQLICEGLKIQKYRNYFVDKINQKINRFYHEITSFDGDVKIEYLPSVLYDDYKTVMVSKREQDIKKGTTSIGPHRDDYVFIINNKNIVNYGSQGQQRSLMISLKLSFVEMLFDEKKEYPIFLLDDVLSELDQERQNNLFKLIDSNVQTILSTATLKEVDQSVLERANIITLEKEM